MSEGHYHFFRVRSVTSFLILYSHYSQKLPKQSTSNQHSYFVLCDDSQLFLRHLWPCLDSCTYPVKVKISHFLYFSRKLRDVVFPVLISSRSRVAIICSISCFKVDCLESGLFLRLQFVPQREQYLRYEHN